MLNLCYLLFVIALIIIATTNLKVHPFLALLIAAILIGFLGGLNSTDVLTNLSEGFGNTLMSVGIIIACGTIIGTFLEHTGGANTIASCVMKLVGEKRSPLAMSITGFIVSIPVFCDSGFVILSTVNKALSRKTGISLAVLAVALSTGLYTTHVFVPPTPGPLAAAGTLGADIGLVLIWGLVVSIPTAGAGLLWAIFYASRFSIVPKEISDIGVEKNPHEDNAIRAFMPLLVPLLLITLKSIADSPAAPFGEGNFRNAIQFLGDPVIALLTGVLLVIFSRKQNSPETALGWVSEGLMSAGSIILITGAGGAFGNILRATGIADEFAAGMADWHLGIILPFLIAAAIKSAQGSSTVAIITTAALMTPLLQPMELTAPIAKALVVLAIGAGSMTVSHFNDSYFWVVSQFSDMNSETALRCHTAATLVQGLTGIATIIILESILV
ncbi:GntP family permease [Bythopirellula polymerisocia]|uniref:DsdX permease n=1 Tax=Bythopirellula polymerisocia TaxID=2528003 RepID=A0A5C6CSJ2_9BACT|nr:GntP family permease [Bythopirellula polymerisocia]TWU27520.1 DsdX permease [Bythopirellula polymerisocia]